MSGLVAGRCYAVKIISVMPTSSYSNDPWSICSSVGLQRPTSWYFVDFCFVFSVEANVWLPGHGQWSEYYCWRVSIKVSVPLPPDVCQWITQGWDWWSGGWYFLVEVSALSSLYCFDVDVGWEELHTVTFRKTCFTFPERFCFRMTCRKPKGYLLAWDHLGSDR